MLERKLDEVIVAIGQIDVSMSMYDTNRRLDDIESVLTRIASRLR